MTESRPGQTLSDARYAAQGSGDAESRPPQQLPGVRTRGGDGLQVGARGDEETVAREDGRAGPGGQEDPAHAPLRADRWLDIWADFALSRA